MAKSSYEKQLDKQMKQEKQLAENNARRERAASIVNGQPLISGFRILDKTAEEFLQCLLYCPCGTDNRVSYESNMFPEYIKNSIALELEKLIQYGMITGITCWLSGGILYLTPNAVSYFVEKEEAYKRQNEEKKKMDVGNITNYGNIVFGNVTDSTLSVDNSIREIERTIDERGGDDKEELYNLLNEIKELIENIETSRTIPKQKNLFRRITDHAAKHGWFYGAVLQLLGTAALSLIGQ